MITAVQAFEVAHRAIAGKRCHDAPCDVAIERAGDTYTVTFSVPAAPSPGPEPTRVLVDAASGTVRELRGAAEPERDPRLAGTIPAARAVEVALRTAREHQITYDEHGTTTAVLVGDTYQVTLPVEETPELTEKADYALRVWVNGRTGEVVNVLGSS
jgi:hypothetical protein